MKKGKLIWYLVAVIPIILLILGYIFPGSFFSSQEKLRDFIEPFGIWAPLVLVLIQIIQVILAPISHYVVGLVGGFLFGTWYGFILNLIGRIIGTLIAFYLGRKLGRKIIRKLVKPKTLEKYDKVFEKGKIILFLIYFLPIFPDDEISYLAGFSSIKAKAFMPIMIIGHIGGSLGLAYAGSGISTKDPLFYLISGITLLGGILFVVLYKKLLKSDRINKT